MKGLQNADLKCFDEIMRIDKQNVNYFSINTLLAVRVHLQTFTAIEWEFKIIGKLSYLASETNRNDQAKKLSTLYQSYQKASEHSIILEGLTNWDELLQAIKAAKQQFNIDLVILDNMTMLKNLISGNDPETEKIGRAISTLKQAAIDTDTAIILVAHTTKLTEGQKVTAYSVNGSANFFNISDYMFSIEISDHEAKETTINVFEIA